MNETQVSQNCVQPPLLVTHTFFLTEIETEKKVQLSCKVEFD